MQRRNSCNQFNLSLTQRKLTMEIFKKEIDGKLHIRIEYTEEEKAEMEAKSEKRKAEMEKLEI